MLGMTLESTKSLIYVFVIACVFSDDVELWQCFVASRVRSSIKTLSAAGLSISKLWWRTHHPICYMVLLDRFTAASRNGEELRLDRITIAKLHYHSNGI